MVPRHIVCLVAVGLFVLASDHLASGSPTKNKSPENPGSRYQSAEKKKPQPERNVVKDPSPEGLLPPAKDDVPSLRPETQDAPKAPKPGPAQKQKASGSVASGPGGDSGVPVGGATGEGTHALGGSLGRPSREYETVERAWAHAGARGRDARGTCSKEVCRF